MEELHDERGAELSEIHREERYNSCEICKKTFFRTKNFSRHTTECEREILTRCETCFTLFTSRGRERQRIRGRIKPFIWNVCKKGFSDRFVMENHTRLHTRKRSFSWKLCKETFTHHSHLKTHLRMHIRELPISCELCKKRYNQSSNLVRHMIVHIEGRHFSYKVCGNLFSQRFDLKRHLRIHTENSLSRAYYARKGLLSPIA
jgi:KRAB domain-containing zinc finger protein